MFFESRWTFHAFPSALPEFHQYYYFFPSSFFLAPSFYISSSPLTHSEHMLRPMLWHRPAFHFPSPSHLPHSNSPCLLLSLRHYRFSHLSSCPSTPPNCPLLYFMPPVSRICSFSSSYICLCLIPSPSVFPSQTSLFLLTSTSSLT